MHFLPSRPQHAKSSFRFWLTYRRIVTFWETLVPSVRFLTLRNSKKQWTQHATMAVIFQRDVRDEYKVDSSYWRVFYTNRTHTKTMEPRISYTKLYTRIRIADTVHWYADAVLVESRTQMKKLIEKHCCASIDPQSRFCTLEVKNKRSTQDIRACPCTLT
jgi:hypothetical protein